MISSRTEASGVFSGLTNGTSRKIVARAILGSGCGTPGVTYASAPSAAVSGTPYGPLVQPSMSASLSGTTITWTWNANRADDGRPTWRAVLTGECSGRALPSGSFSKDYGYGPETKSCTLTISADGVSSKSASASKTTPSPPPPSVSNSKGASTSACGACYYVKLSGTNFPKSSAVSHRCGGADTPTGWSSWYSTALNGNSISTNASGAFSTFESRCYHAYTGNGVDYSQDIQVKAGTVTVQIKSSWPP